MELGPHPAGDQQWMDSLQAEGKWARLIRSVEAGETGSLCGALCKRERERDRARE